MKKYTYLLLMMAILFFSCNHEKSSINKETLLTHYSEPKDSLKREALLFLLENMDDQTSDVPFFCDASSEKEVDLLLDTIRDSYMLQKIIQRRKLKTFVKVLPDNVVITNDFLLKDVDLAFEHWNKYPWANDIPKDIFMNYLLPYKVYGEQPTEWRTLFSEKYQDSIRILVDHYKKDSLLMSTNGIYYMILVNEVGSWYKYSDNAMRLTDHPGMKELLLIKKGSCYEWSYLNVCILRSLGIPSSMDFVPLWGRKNGTHFTEVFWDDDHKNFRTASGREIISTAKVFRYSFKKQNQWRDSIEPVVRQEPFLLEHLKHDHWQDVTHEHTKTVDIEYVSSNKSDFSYICVYNYGQWESVYWGENKQEKVTFKNMGTGLLYRVASPLKNSYEIISPIFYVDSLGNKKYYNPDMNNKVTLKLAKVNDGGRAWVEKEKDYSLYYSDKESNWHLQETKKCMNDSVIIFQNVPSATLYKLLDEKGNKPLERIFTYEGGAQKWW